MRRVTLKEITKMHVKLFLAIAIVATSSLLLQTTEAQAQGRRQYRQNYGDVGLATQYYGYPSSRIVVRSNGFYGSRAYYPSASYLTGYRSYNAYGYPNQIPYSRGYGYRSGNSYRSGYGGYGYRSQSGLSIGIGVGGFGNRGYLLQRNSTQANLMRARFGRYSR